MQTVTLGLAARIIVSAGAFALMVGGLDGLILFPGNRVSPIIIPLGMLVCAITVPRAYWAVLFCTATAFAGMLTLSVAVRYLSHSWLEGSIQKEPWLVPPRFYLAFLYFVPLLIQLSILRNARRRL